MNIIDKYGGYTISKKTGKFLTIEEMDELATEFDKVRDKMTVDEFMIKHVTSMSYKERCELDGER